MKLTTDLLESVPVNFNPLMERELNLRGLDIPEIENLSILKDKLDCIDLSNNQIKAFENFPPMNRLNMLLLNNNKISRISSDISLNLPSLKTLILTSNRITDLSEIDKLEGLKMLINLSFMDNPVIYNKKYREYTISKLPQLLFLDFQKVTEKERKDALAQQTS